MVFFSCDGCGEMLKKSQVDKHVYRCRRQCPSVSCVDCNVAFFDGTRLYYYHARVLRFDLMLCCAVAFCSVLCGDDTACM